MPQVPSDKTCDCAKMTGKAENDCSRMQVVGTVANRGYVRGNDWLPLHEMTNHKFNTESLLRGDQKKLEKTTPCRRPRACDQSTCIIKCGAFLRPTGPAFFYHLHLCPLFPRDQFKIVFNESQDNIRDSIFKKKLAMTLASGSGSSPVERDDEAARRLDEIALLDLSASDILDFTRPSRDTVSGWASDSEQIDPSEDDSDAESPSEGELLEHTLREHARRDKDGRKFWPYALLARLMTREQLRSVLLAEVTEVDVEATLERLGLLYDSSGDAPFLHDPLQTRETEAADRCDGYLRVFAILALLGRLDSLPRFLKASLNDADLLNLRVDERLSRYKLRLLGRIMGSKIVSMIFRNWRTVELEMFVQHKESVSPPLFQSTKSGWRPYTTLSDESTLPWRTADERGTSYGGFGAVHKVTLDPLSYYFEGRGNTVSAPSSTYSQLIIPRTCLPGLLLVGTGLDVCPKEDTGPSNSRRNVEGRDRHTSPSSAWLP